MKRRARAGVAIGVGLLASEARSEPTRDPVAAEALFQQGKESWAKGRPGEACARFEASMALDPSVSALLKVARCREREGKLSQAWYLYQRAIALNLEMHRDRPARREELERFARQALAELTPRVPRLSIKIAGAPEGLSVHRDGVELPAQSLGEALPVDPGEHEVVARAPLYTEARRSASLAEGESLELRLELTPLPPAGTEAPRPEVPPGDPAAQAGAPPAASAGLEARGEGGRPWWWTAGWGVGAGGLVGLGVAGYFGLETLRLVRRSAPECTPDDRCTGAGISLRSQAREAQARGLVALGVGVGLAAGGGVMVLLARPGKRVSLQAGPGQLWLAGSW